MHKSTKDKKLEMSLAYKITETVLQSYKGEKYYEFELSYQQPFLVPNMHPHLHKSKIYKHFPVLKSLSSAPHVKFANKNLLKILLKRSQNFTKGKKWYANL